FQVPSESPSHSDEPLTVAYTPGESTSHMFGGNSNWRGPVWMPVNFLIIEALEKYSYFYGDALQVEFPTGSGNQMNLRDVALELSKRLIQLFVKNDAGLAPYHGGASSSLLCSSSNAERFHFHEYFHGDTGRGLGACHQTGWTALVALLLDKIARVGTSQDGVVGSQLSL
ncbi:MAG: hypothetical protein KDD60_02955, partial [Bdellovibrionales bacterium]|nr:hypothetical protein [Bdellovibrionales bacterium]